ncbi:thioredoxin family protein [Cohnella soli]|uniref:Thioredoxin n=1 Tax=Cohnella soli TaxID=425005 RepID=A0ABW0I1W8_9BACL
MLVANDESLQGSIRQQGVTLVDFGAKWCPPCKVLKPILDELAEEKGEAAMFIEIDCDDSPGAASTYGVMSMPTVIVFRDGEAVEKIVGLRPKAVYEGLIAKHS